MPQDQATSPQDRGTPPHDTISALGVELLRLNLNAYRLGHHGLAHHLLSAALHCAQASGDRVLAEGIRQRAEDQRSELKRSPVAGRGPFEGTRDRGIVTMFDSVAVMAASVSQRLQPRSSPGIFVRRVRRIP
jgi:hypothetical protein